MFIKIFLFGFLLGCSTFHPATTPHEMQSEPIPKLELGAGDVLEIKFFYNPELNEIQTVRPDGIISLPFVGEVEVRGRTPSELQDSLIKSYTPIIRKPEIVVVVRSLSNRRVFVGGEVNKPGLIEMTGRLTALEAIMQAGGFNLQTAQVKNIVVIRSQNGRQYGCLLDFSETLKGGETQSFFLEPSDVVYVPRTVIVNVNQWIDQYINKLVPQFGATYIRTLTKGSIGIDTSAR